MWGLVCGDFVGGELWMVSGGVSTFWLWGLGFGLGWLGVWAQLVRWNWLADVRIQWVSSFGFVYTPAKKS